MFHVEHFCAFFVGRFACFVSLKPQKISKNLNFLVDNQNFI